MHEGGATEKDLPKRPTDRQLQEAQKDPDRAITPAGEALCALHTWRRQGP